MSDFRSRLPRPWQQPLISLPKLLLSYPVRTRSSKPIAPKAPKVRELLFDARYFRNSEGWMFDSAGRAESENLRLTPC